LKLDGGFSPLRKDIKEHLRHMSEAEIVLFVGYLCCPIQERVEEDGTVTGITDPTIRQLCEMLPIGRTTIIYAKQALAARGFIKKAGKSRVEIPKYKKLKSTYSEPLGVNSSDIEPCGKLDKSPNGSKVEPYSSDSEPQGSKVEPSKEEKEMLTTATSPPGQCQANRMELESLQRLKGVKAYPFEYEVDLEHLRTLTVDFPDVDVHSEVKKWVTNKLDNPLKKRSNPRLQLRNWMEKAREFSKKAAQKQKATSTNTEALQNVYKKFEEEERLEEVRSG